MHLKLLVATRHEEEKEKKTKKKKQKKTLVLIESHAIHSQKYGTKCVPYQFNTEQDFYVSNTERFRIIRNGWQP